MSTESERNISPASGSSPHPARTRIRYVLAQGTVIGGVYEIERPLGHGGMGEVYLVRHKKLDIYRAVKILLPKVAAANPMFATRFMQEARLAIQIQHPNIINVMDANRDERLNIYYIVMELVDGYSIRNLLKRNGVFEEKEALEIALYAGRALEEADRKNIVHRDIKPDNIMITKENKVKIADLGIAKSLVDNCLTADSADGLIGTPSYISPEQFENARQVDCRADIYSLGVTLYEMLTGEKPYKGTGSVEILNQLISSPVPDVRKKNQHVSSRTAKLIMKMMDKDRDCRPLNWTEFCTSVENILGRTMTISVAQSITREAKRAARNFSEEEENPVQGMIMDDRRPFRETVKPKLKKLFRRLLTVLVIFGVCYVMTNMLSGSGKREKWRREFTLLCWGGVYKEQCRKYNLNPPWNMTFASDLAKQMWIDRNKPAPVDPTPVPPPDPRDKTPPGSPEYTGTGSLQFVFDEKTAQAVREYLKGGKVIFTWKNTTREVKLPGTANDIPAAVYVMQVSIPGCKSYDREVDLRKDCIEQVPVVPVPEQGTVNVNCSEPGIEFCADGGDWHSGSEIRIDALKTVELTVRKQGFRYFMRTVYLNRPGENLVLHIDLEKLPSAKKGYSAELKKAEEDYRGKKYGAALKTYRNLAGLGDRVAFFRLGEFMENGYMGEIADRRRAYHYYKLSAEQGYKPAIFRAGDLCESGFADEEKNEEKALSWYLKGAKLDDAGCLYRAGELYRKGFNGNAPDAKKASEYYKRGAEKQDGLCEYRLGQLYEDVYEEKKHSGSPWSETTKYGKLAVEYYKRAANHGIEEAAKDLERMNNE